MSNDNSTPIDPVTGIPARPLRTFADVVWKEPDPPASNANDGTTPAPEVDPYTGKPKPRPLRTWDQVIWKK